MMCIRSQSPQLTINAQVGYAATLFYAPMTLSIKLSLLSLIARVFAPYKRKVQGIYALGVILIIYYITSWILKIRICTPISAYWRLETDKCLDQSAIILGDSIVSTITDAIICCVVRLSAHCNDGATLDDSLIEHRCCITLMMHPPVTRHRLLYCWYSEKKLST
jgi:hypothetical protein